MSDLLVGCRASVADAAIKDGIIVKVDRSHAGGRYVWILLPDGSVTTESIDCIIVHPDDVKFIIRMNRNYKLREQNISQKTERFEMLDL